MPRVDGSTSKVKRQGKPGENHGQKSHCLRFRPSRKTSLLSDRVALGRCHATFVKSRRSSAANSCVPAGEGGREGGKKGVQGGDGDYC